MTIFERIKTATKKRGKTIRQVAEEAGFSSESAIYRYNQGVTPRPVTLKTIARAIPTTTDFLLGKTDDWQIPSKQTPSESDLDKMIDNARSFDGKPMDEHDREIAKRVLKAIFKDKKE